MLQRVFIQAGSGGVGTILKDYDLVLNSQDSKTLEKSMKIVKANGKAISISGPPDVDYADINGFNWLLKTAI